MLLCYTVLVENGGEGKLTAVLCLQSDLKKLASLGGVDAVFAPSVSEMFPPSPLQSSAEAERGASMTVVVPRAVEGVSAESLARPGKLSPSLLACPPLSPC